MAKVKRTISTSKPSHSVGLEYDHLGIRAAKLVRDGRGGIAVDRLEEVKGHFAEDANLIEGLKVVKAKLDLNARDHLVTCIAGKQVFAAQIPFRRLPPEEMEQALRLELRKSVHFEASGATLDYQILSEAGNKADEAQVLVALVAQGLVSKQLRILDMVGLKPMAMDVLPVVVANTQWAWLAEKQESRPVVAIHIGPQVTTIVIDGHQFPLFNRNVPFPAEDIFGKGREALSDRDREKRVLVLVEEVSRSLAFYEKTHVVAGFKDALLLGEYLGPVALEEPLRRQTGLKAQRAHLAVKLGFPGEVEAGRFDLAIALGMRKEI